MIGSILMYSLAQVQPSLIDMSNKFVGKTKYFSLLLFELNLLIDIAANPFFGAIWSDKYFY